MEVLRDTTSISVNFCVYIIINLIYLIFYVFNKSRDHLRLGRQCGFLVNVRVDRLDMRRL